LDLVQAEAVADLISARTEMSADLALAQMGGGLSRRVKETRQEILDILSYIEASIDFPEDETDNLAFMELSRKLEITGEHAAEIFASSKKGKVIREGLSTVIAGKPNVGKSSLLNALLREERAIVTDIPGTTRDEIHEYLKIGKILLHLVDTAGVRASEDPVEIMGIERTWKELNRADIILLLLDARQLQKGEFTKEERVVLEDYAGKVLVLVNKIDLLTTGVETQLLEADAAALLAQLPAGVQGIPFSVKKHRGFEELEKNLCERVWDGKNSVAEEPLLANIRQIQAMENCLLALEKAEEALKNMTPLDLVSIDIRAALEAISQITGDHVQEDLLENIFSKFCIGK
jgi:tRNA modification GTPase